MIHTSGLQRVLTLLDTELSVIAVGTGTAPAVGETVLTSENYRKSITAGTIDGAVLIKEVFLDETEANITITEIGVLGNGASPTVTGSLFASGGASITKNSTQSLTISFEIEAKEVS